MLIYCRNDDNSQIIENENNNLKKERKILRKILGPAWKNNKISENPSTEIKKK